MTVYQERKPEPTDIPNAELASVLTSNKQAIRFGIEQHSYWTVNSGVSAGLMILSDGSFGPGAARAFFDVGSNASSQLSASKALAGRLYITSDTSRLYGYDNSGHTFLLGSANAISYFISAATQASNFNVLAQMGSFSMGSTSTTTTAFPTAYAAVAPIVQLMVQSSGTTSFYQPALVGSTTTNFTTALGNVYGAASPLTIWWRSHGTVAL